MLKPNSLCTLHRGIRHHVGTRSFSANPLAQGKDVFLPFPKRQVKQPVSFGETISFNLHDVWSKLPNVTINKNTTLGEIVDGYYTNYNFRKMYGVTLFVGFVFWLLHVKYVYYFSLINLDLAVFCVLITFLPMYQEEDT